ncbi:MAG: DNA-protecting protein DprA [Rubripirellula sp.]|nr:DNA-protecting protein DprA [Rubripirellula sp.]
MSSRFRIGRDAERYRNVLNSGRINPTHYDLRASSSAYSENTDLSELLLALTPGVGPRILARLLNQFGKADEVLRAPFHDLLQVTGVGPKLARSIVRSRQVVPIHEIMTWCEKNHCKILQRGSKEYPRRLKEIDDAPLILFAQGSFTALHQPMVALVGTRHPTPYGEQQARRFARELTEAGMTIVSGLARGIDGVSHQSCIERDGQTIAVLGSGLGRIYPPEHLNLAKKIRHHGMLLSEYAPLHQPQKSTFPQRNRIISGLCSITLVIEAPQKSGSLITARLALEQNREVMAIPGPISSELSRGCNELICDGAKLVQSVDDVIEELHLPSAVPLTSTPFTNEYPQQLNAEHTSLPEKRTTQDWQKSPATIAVNQTEQQILEAISPDGSLLDSIIHRTGFAPQKVIAAVSLLEIRGLIARSHHQKIYRK